MSDEAAPQHANVLYPAPFLMMLMMLLMMLLLMTLLQMADECFGCRWSCSTAAAGPSPVAQELGLTLELELELGEVVAWLAVVVPHAAAPPQQVVRWRQPCAWQARELDGERRCAWT